MPRINRRARARDHLGSLWTCVCARAVTSGRFASLEKSCVCVRDERFDAVF